MTEKIKVAITDDHALIREGLERILREQPNMEVSGVYACGKDLLEGLREKMPDVLLLDIQLPDYTGNQLTRIISAKYPTLRILALSSMDTLYHIKDMMEHGCMGYLTKQTDTPTLLQAVKTLYAGEQFLLPDMKAQWIQSITEATKERTQLTPLTQREKEILQLIVNGKTNQEIGAAFFISPRTVESHRQSLMQKLEVKNAFGLMKAALQLGLVE